MTKSIVLCRLRDPDYKVLARGNEHAVDVRELDGSNRSRVEVKNPDLLACLYVPDEYFLFAVLASCDEKFAVWTEPRLEDLTGG